MEEDIIKGANEYYHLAEKYDKKINNIVNRYENRTNQLFMDLRNREVEHRILCNKIDYVIRNTMGTLGTLSTTSNDSNMNDIEIDTTYRHILYCLYIYTFFVITMLFSIKY